MPITYLAIAIDITLPKSHQVRFPDRCVVCNCDSPGTHVRLAADSGSWFMLIDWLWTKPFFVQVPACRKCGRKLRLLRWVSEVLTWSCAFSMIYLIWPQVKPHVAMEYQTWIFVALLCSCLVPQTIWQFLYLLPFDFTAHKDHVVYQFASPVQAISFVVANQSAPWVKWDGTIVDSEWKEARLRALASLGRKPKESPEE